MVIGVTPGTFDLFHIGHLNLLKRARAQCDFLIVIVSSAERCFGYKNQRPIISDYDRLEIIRSCRFVDDVFLNSDSPELMAEVEWAAKLGAKKFFLGDDWKGVDRLAPAPQLLGKIGCELIFLPRTVGISTSDIIKRICSTGGINDQ